MVLEIHFNKRNFWQITGGSSGIGLGVAHDVARRGASVTLVARNVANLEKALEEVRSTASKAGAGGKVQTFSGKPHFYIDCC